MRLWYVFLSLSHAAFLSVGMMIGYGSFTGPRDAIEAAAIAGAIAWSSFEERNGNSQQKFIEYAKALDEAKKEAEESGVLQELYTNQVIAWGMIALLTTDSDERRDHLAKAHAHCVDISWKDCSNDALLGIAQSVANARSKQ